ANGPRALRREEWAHAIRVSVQPPVSVRGLVQVCYARGLDDARLPLGEGSVGILAPAEPSTPAGGGQAASRQFRCQFGDRRRRIVQGTTPQWNQGATRRSSAYPAVVLEVQRDVLSRPHHHPGARQGG